MSWIKFHGEIRKGKHRGIPRALRFVFLELAHEARPLRGVVELPAGMTLLDGVHDILGGDRREVRAALDLYTKGPDPDAPSIIVESGSGALRLRIPSWEAWNRVDDSAERTREYRRKKREAAAGDDDVTRHATVTTSHHGDASIVTVTAQEERREEEIREIPPSPPSGGAAPGFALSPPTAPEDGSGDRGERKKPASRAKDGGRRAKMVNRPAAWEPNEGHRRLAAEAGADLAAEIPRWEDYHRAHGTQIDDFDASLRTWLRNSKRFANGRSPAAPTSLQPMAKPGTGGWMDRPEDRF